MLRRLLAVAVALVLAGVSGSAAQVSVGVGGQYLSLGGTDFDGTDAGFGGEARVLFPVGTSLMVGAGGQYSIHGYTGSSESFNVLGLLAEARYMFKTPGGKVSPYVAGRGGYVRASDSNVDLGAGPTDVSQSGFAFGGGGGVMISLTPGLGLDFGAIFHSVSLGDAEAYGQTQPGSEASGTGLQIRGGISFKLGAR